MANVSGNAAALKFVDGLEEALHHLSEFPRMGVTPKWGTLARRRFRSFVVAPYILLYTDDEASSLVIVEAAVHARREYWWLV